MKSEYTNLKNSFEQILSRFRFQWLLSDLLKGFAILFLCFLAFLVVYYCFISLSPLTVSFKFVFFLVFILCLVSVSGYFVLYPLFLFISSFNWKKDILLNRILKYSSGTEDLLISMFYLAFRPEKVQGDPKLKEAAFIQKYKVFFQKENKVPFPSSSFLYPGFVLLIFLGIFLTNQKYFTGLSRDLLNYREVYNPRFNVDFKLLNPVLEVEYGKPFRLKLQVRSDYLSVENVFVCFGGGEFLMNKTDSVFLYDFDVVNNDIGFYFKTEGIQSKMFKIHVLPVPEVLSYRVTVTPPAYTGLKPEVYKDAVDFRVLYGSVVRFDAQFSEVDSLFLKFEDQIAHVPFKSASRIDFTKNIVSSGDYSFLGTNKDFSRRELINFHIHCIPDLYPGIQISEMQDSLNPSLYYFYGIITDDYGFSNLRFNYSLNGKNPTVMPINISRNLNTQEFYFEFDFSEFAGMEKSQIQYFFEVFDNDVLSGPKSTRSDTRNFLVPDLNSIFEYNLQTNTDVNAALTEAEKLAKNIVSDVKNLQKKILDNSADQWEKQQLAKDIVEKKEKLDKLLQEVKEENLKKSVLNSNFTKQDSILRSKQEKIQELLDKVMDDEMKKLMEEFNKLAQEFSKDKFGNLEEKMKLSFDQLSEELDRNLELLKRFQLEEQHTMLSRQMEKLKEKQDNFSKQEEASMERDSLMEEAGNIKDNLKNISEHYQQLEKENQQLAEPFKLESLKEDFERLSEDLEKQEQNASQEKKDERLSEKVRKQMDKLSDKLEQQAEQNFMKMSLPQQDIELIIQNILLISFSQESLLQQFKNVPAQSAQYNELGRIQELKRLEYKIVKDSLSVLAKSNLMLASFLNDKFYDIEIKYGLLPGYIQNNKRSELFREQQAIINYLNDMALALSDALQKSKEEGNSGAGGDSGNKGGKKKESGKGGKGKGYEGMKKLQEGLRKQMENLLEQMKRGEKGKPFQQGISKMIRENELFRKSLNEFMNENGALSAEEKQLLNEINQLIEDNIREIANYSVTNNLVKRNNLIYNKLLMSEKASKEREEYEEKRKSVTAADKKFDRPEFHFNLTRKSGLMKTDIQKSGIQLNPYFKNLYNNYYIKLGNE